MDKNDLIAILSAKENVNSSICQKVVDTAFLELSKVLAPGQGVTIEGIGIFDAHKKKTHKTPKNKTRGEEDCSIFFHPDAAIKNRITKILKDEPPDQL